MKEIRDITACVVDHGLFLPVAQKLAEQFKKVYWWSPSERTMPRLSEGLVGRGFENLERVFDIWGVKSECDLFVFPDVGFAGLQRELIGQGFPVWGHRGGDVLETNRGKFLQTLEEVGMVVPPHRVITGFSELRDYLKDAADKWIKVSRWRGDWETLHWRDWQQDESTLDMAAYHLGPAKELLTFYVFDRIESKVEDGIDTYCIEGQFPETVIHGLEHKDKSFLCAVQPMADVAECIRVANEKFAPVLERFGYRGAFSTEVRVTEEESYFIDPTCRFPSPGSQAMVELFGNLGEIIAAGAEGVCIEPKPAANYGVQALISCSREKDEWLALTIPEEIRQWAKLSFACEIDGRVCLPPSDLGPMLGWLVATGETIAGAIDSLKEYRALLPEGLDCDVESIASLLIEAEAAAEHSIELGEGRVPDPATVLED
jgi:hypothetical protein